MTVFNAMLLDAYRELNAKRLFWITLAISGLVAAVFAFVGITDEGIRVITWDVPFPGLNAKVISPDTFYKLMFVNFGVGFWLAWLASILALVSTAGIFPSFISGGTIDLVLAKPIGRLPLFLLKYLTGLLFVALQVAAFTTAAFLVMGVRGGTWEPAVFLAIPIVVVFFSYLFAVCALLGLLTRSTIAALLLTLLFWLLIFAVHSVESTTLMFKTMAEEEAQATERHIEIMQQRLDRHIELDEKSTGENDHRTRTIDQIQTRIAERRQELQSTRDTAETLDTVHWYAYGVKSILPKTAETIALLERALIDLSELPMENSDAASQQENTMMTADGQLEQELQSDPSTDEQAQREVMKAFRDRSIWWVMGTSLLFECLVLALGAWLFCRRDF